MVNLCQWGTGCFGCCGHSYKDKESVLEDIRKNMVEYQFREDDYEFMVRSGFLRVSGVCRNVGLKDEKIICLIHPEVIGTEIRESYCQNHYLCLTMREFMKWDEKKQKLFIEFLEKKKLDWYAYSINMDNDSLLKEFESNLR